MTQQTKAAHGGPRETEPEQDATPADQRNKELDEDVACCLADIDEALEGVESERDRALREFGELKARDERGENVAEELRLWEARYTHLQLTFGRYCCSGELYAYDQASDQVVS